MASWLRVSLESNPELISTPAVEFEAKFHEAEACGILRVEFSINSKIGFENIKAPGCKFRQTAYVRHD